MHEHRPFMEVVIQPLLSATENRGIVAWVGPTHAHLIPFTPTNHRPQREFTLLLFPLLARKLRRSMPSLLPHPPVLAHTIYQALVFDAAVAESGFGLAGTSAAASEKWNGVSDVILGKEEWFAAWMDGEKQCMLLVSNFVYIDICAAVAEDQYHEIISAVDAWHIAEEEGEGNEEASHLRELRSTNSARRLKALVEQITGNALTSTQSAISYHPTD